MLAGISIRDVVIIDRLDLSFHGGLGVLTGETGAGKSILLDALGLALGERSDAGLVRAGAERATVSAAFEPPAGHPVYAFLTEHGLEADGAIVLRRVLGRDGRSRAFVNDQPTSVGLLRQIGESLVEVLGQFEQRGLLDPATHRETLDAYAGTTALTADTEAAYAAWRATQQALANAEEAVAKARADEEYLRHALDELDTLDPKPSEEAALAEKRSALMNREKLVQALEDARAELTDPRNVEDALRRAQALLIRASQGVGDIFTPVIEACERAAVEAGEALRILGSASVDVEGAGENLESIEERLFGLRDAARKHRVTVDDLPKVRETMRERLAALDDQTGSLAQLKAEVEQALGRYTELARELSKRRREAASALDAAVAAELPPLRLEKASFHTRIDTLPESDWGPGGIDRIAFEVATNPGAAPGPLRKIASGGELARFMLALKVVLASASPVPTLIFDEVDAGIGGATAAAVGERLGRLAQDVQVLVVTHSPQVAARGAHHWRVLKTEAGEGVTTVVHELPGPDRREEIARMLSGAQITEEARAAADRLIAGGAA
jgi:DNA repair protein RecN (Recombination protein N)